jgi:CRISPR/Cas system CSM-associated protein Csm4 (group 5 of RAMP superfamily)
LHLCSPQTRKKREKGKREKRTKKNKKIKFAKEKKVYTFAARKRGRKRGVRAVKKANEKIKNKVCKLKKGSYLCNPKRKGG